MKDILQSTENNKPLYDSIGSGYALTRREDPRLYNRILAELCDSQSVVNIGAGTGSYEPRNLNVLAVEPSEIMVSQRPPGAGPAIRAMAHQLPLHDKSFDAAMTVISIHHWHPHLRKGIEEMCRVARKHVIIVTYDTRISNKMWLLADYLKETAELDAQVFPFPEDICSWLNCDSKIESVLHDKDTPDWNLGSLWAHPERVLDAKVRSAISGFSRQPNEVVQRVVSDIERDLMSGQWDKKYGHLRNLSNFDVGLRIISANLEVI